MPAAPSGFDRHEATGRSGEFFNSGGFMAKYSKAVVGTLLVGAMLGLAAGCKKQASASDETIAQDIQTKVAADPVTKDSAITVAAKDGKVTLKGTAKDTATQQKIEQIAHDEPGATSVSDETAVVEGAAAAADQAANTPAPTPAPAPPPPQPIVVPAGTSLTVTVDQALSSKTSQAGQTFLATLARPISIDGKSAIPKGASVTGTVITAKEKGKIKGEGQLSLALTSITIRGKNYNIQTGALDSTVKGKGKRTAVTTGGGAAGGALIGGIAGGGKGAGIGALVGAAGGLVGGAFTGNKQIEIPAETPLTFTLSSSLTLPPRAE
jgi:BON domain